MPKYKNFSIETTGHIQCSPWAANEYVTGGNFAVEYKNKNKDASCQIVMNSTDSTDELSNTEQCCLEKTVGNLNYKLVEKRNNVYKNCKNGCIYKKDGDETDSKYCFAVGNKKVECKEESLYPLGSFDIFNQIANVNGGFVRGTVNWIGTVKCKELFYIGVSILHTTILQYRDCPQIVNVTANITYNPSGERRGYYRGNPQNCSGCLQGQWTPNRQIVHVSIK